MYFVKCNNRFLQEVITAAQVWSLLIALTSGQWINCGDLAIVADCRLWQKLKRECQALGLKRRVWLELQKSQALKKSVKGPSTCALTECALVFVHMHRQAECGGLRASVCLKSALLHCVYTVQYFFQIGLFLKYFRT